MESDDSDLGDLVDSEVEDSDSDYIPDCEEDSDEECLVRRPQKRYCTGVIFYKMHHYYIAKGTCINVWLTIVCGVPGECGVEHEPKYIVLKVSYWSSFNTVSSVMLCVRVMWATPWVLVQVVQHCDKCQARRVWDSQPYLSNVPAGNLLLSGAMLFTGCHPVQVLRMFDVYGVFCIATNTFFRHQRSYLQPTIVNAWHDEQTNLLRLLKECYSSQVILAVDGRSDSPGHCA